MAITRNFPSLSPMRTALPSIIAMGLAGLKNIPCSFKPEVYAADAFSARCELSLTISALEAAGGSASGLKPRGAGVRPESIKAAKEGDTGLGGAALGEPG